MGQPIWVLISCNTIDETAKLGALMLETRLVACFDVHDRIFSQFFWPPGTDKTEKAKGALLIATSFQEKYEEIKKVIKDNHSDKVPFIGFIKIDGVNQDYLEWMEKELLTNSTK